jgi:nicotinate-nucleotide adenylyltransferase
LSPAAHAIVGVFGGTFDPPHGAHLELARTVLEHGAADRILFVPCFRHAFGKRPAAFAHRVAMCELLVADEPRMEVSDVEAAMESPGRTLDLLAALEAARPGDGLRLIVGSDIYFEREKWYRYEEIERRAPPVYVARRGVPPIPVPALPAPADLSSSDIRERIKAGQSPGDLLPARVAEYVERQRLYGWRG